MQWLPDLRRWYRADEGKTLTAKRNLIYTIARPTRPPGQYSAVWDLKDDAGNPVPPGSYTLRIDSAREHGTYHHISKEIIIGATPFTEELQGNDEIRAASLDYRRAPDAR